MGFLLLNKPSGITSFGAVARVKRLAGEKRVGHTGTLDPMATGVLPIFIGRATALSSYLLEADKTYIAGIRLGVITDTLDITGTVTDTMSPYKMGGYTNERVEKVLTQFCGKQKQRPPMYSAIKKDGVRLYDMARKGISIDLPERDIEIFSISLTKPLDENYEFEITCRVSKGTYIRSLCRDIGNALGCGATLVSLCRTESSGFDIKDCADLNALDEKNIKDYIIDEEVAVSHFKAVNVTEKQAIRFSNGGKLALDRVKIEDCKDREIIRVKYKKRFLGLGTVDLAGGELAIKCIINGYKAGEN